MNYKRTIEKKRLLRPLLSLLMSIVTMAAAAGVITVNGVVMDETGEPLIGASVRTKDTAKITVTDAEGEFKLRDVKPGEEIIITYVGYVSKSVKAVEVHRLEITLVENPSVLDEVVVVGYGTQKKDYCFPKHRLINSLIRCFRS